MTTTTKQQTNSRTASRRPATKAKSIIKNGAAKTASPRSSAQRSNTKLETCLTLLVRKNGATLADLIKATGWQAHSVRGFLSGTIKKKLGHNLVSEKKDNKTRRYHVEA